MTILVVSPVSSSLRVPVEDPCVTATSAISIMLCETMTIVQRFSSDVVPLLSETATVIRLALGSCCGTIPVQGAV